MPTSLAKLEEIIEYRFTDQDLLRLALTHPSVCHENPSELQHNQRLEFLGDSVLGLVLTHEFYLRFPYVGEGSLTKARAHLVNRRTLADKARGLKLGGFLILSHGEESSGGRNRPSSLADAFEALLGAVFLDGGLEAARQVILHCFQDALGDLAEVPYIDNPKGELQEFLQARSAQAPVYELASVTGPDHERIFECAVFHRGQELARGVGKSKKAAESEAALTALTVLKQTSAEPSESAPMTFDSEPEREE